MDIIIQFSPVRTGSTLIYNILKDLGKNLKKTHNIRTTIPKMKPTIITYRNPFDSIISFMDCDDKLDKNATEQPNDILIKYTNKYINCGGKDLINNFELLKKNNKVCILKYEDFVDNHDYIYDKLEKYYNTKICEVVRMKLKEKFEITQVKKSILKYNSFVEYDRNTYFHGKHISVDDGKVERYKKYLSCKNIDMMINIFIQSNINIRSFINKEY